MTKIDRPVERDKIKGFYNKFNQISLVFIPSNAYIYIDLSSFKHMEEQLYSIGKTAKLLGVSIDTIRRWDREGLLISFRPSIKSKRHFRKKDVETFLEKSGQLTDAEIIITAKKWVTTESAFQLSSSWYCKTSDIFNGRLDTFAQELQKLPGLEKSFPLVVAVAGEIGNNSYNHNIGNWHDTPGSFFGYDTVNRIAVLADRGQGVLGTLKRVLPDLKNDREALNAAFTQYVSGRAPENRGNGLKFVKDVITGNPFTLQFSSGYATLKLGKDNPEVSAGPAEFQVHGCLAILTF